MGEKALEIKPHHAEGAQRFMAWGKNESHKEMLDLLRRALVDNPDAELVFTRGYDAYCKAGCLKEGQIPPCVKEYGSESVTSIMDEEVAREHGWEFDKPYKISDILRELEDEASNRQIFYVTKLTQDQHSQWLADVRESKKKK